MAPHPRGSISFTQQYHISGRYRILFILNYLYFFVKSNLPSQMSRTLAKSLRLNTQPRKRYCGQK